MLGLVFGMHCVSLDQHNRSKGSRGEVRSPLSDGQNVQDYMEVRPALANIPLPTPALLVQNHTPAYCAGPGGTQRFLSFRLKDW